MSNFKFKASKLLAKIIKKTSNNNNNNKNYSRPNTLINLLSNSCPMNQEN